MRIAVSGSIATDHLMTFPGRFVDQLLPDQLANLSVSFLVDDLDVRRGGVAGNICFGLGVLGLSPVLIGAVGSDFADYRSWLESHGVDTSGVRVSETRQTARFVCTTDTEQNQIASFYPGAMTEAREIDLGLLGQLDLVMVGPNDPSAMAAHTTSCRNRGVRFAADPSQQLASLDGAAIRNLLTGAEFLFCNAYESALLESKTGLSPAEVLDTVGTRVTTHGAQGIVISKAGEPEIRVGVVRATRLTDPTGVGDAFRAGFLAGQSWDLTLERSAQVGALMATLCVESLGPQEYDVDAATARTRLATAYGEDAAAEIAALLPSSGH
ncbi:MAG: carbohydrate kinase family protein [Frankiaceae bacterium]|nr:carbohydrate kinase family protein [Frankiaceae bacterium]MBV9871431.1 carbohydrate kinase family protein [Frankiaceae bacterium]